MHWYHARYVIFPGEILEGFQRNNRLLRRRLFRDAVNAAVEGLVKHERHSLAPAVIKLRDDFNNTYISGKDADIRCFRRECPVVGLPSKPELDRILAQDLTNEGTLESADPDAATAADDAHGNH